MDLNPFHAIVRFISRSGKRIARCLHVLQNEIEANARHELEGREHGTGAGINAGEEGDGVHLDLQRAQSKASPSSGGWLEGGMLQLTAPERSL